MMSLPHSPRPIWCSVDSGLHILHLFPSRQVTCQVFRCVNRVVKLKHTHETCSVHCVYFWYPPDSLYYPLCMVSQSTILDSYGQEFHSSPTGMFLHQDGVILIPLYIRLGPWPPYLRLLVLVSGLKFSHVASITSWTSFFHGTMFFCMEDLDIKYGWYKVSGCHICHCSGMLSFNLIPKMTRDLLVKRWLIGCGTILRSSGRHKKQCQLKLTDNVSSLWGITN